MARGVLNDPIVRTTCAVMVFTTLLSAPALAEPLAANAPPVPPPTFRYTTPVDPNPLRATLELGGVLALGFVWYATTSTDIVHQWDVNYDFETFREKITGQAFGADTNQFGTNFIGHPLGGTGYYLAARSNRLTILESFGYSLAGSLLWELFGEVSEVVSMNDSLVTPVAGLAIGESTTQLGAFFDRSGPSSMNRTLGSVFGPFKSLNDALDGVKPARSSSTFPEDEWHRFELTASAVGIYEENASGEWWPEAQFAASSRLARFTGYEAPASDSQAFDEANVSALELRFALGRRGLSDFLFNAEVVLAGIHFRARSRDENGREYGGNGILGVATTFRYALHDYARDESRPLDRLSSVEPVSLVFEQRGVIGRPRIATRVDAGPGFAGVTPHALGALPGKPSDPPPILDRHGYYFGLGGHLGAAIEVEDGRLGARLDVRAEGYRAFAGPGESKAFPISDVATRQSFRLAYRLHKSPVALVALADHRGRSGRLASARSASSEHGVGAGVGAVF
jgi:hypothetical protein